MNVDRSLHMNSERNWGECAILCACMIVCVCVCVRVHVTVNVCVYGH